MKLKSTSHGYRTYLLCFVAFLSSCAQLQRPEKTTPNIVSNTVPVKKEKKSTTTLIDGELSTPYHRFDLAYSQSHYDFWQDYFEKKDHERFQRFVNNGLNFYPVITKIFQEYGLPQELFFVGLIESGYYTSAKSHAKAVGPWQFIASTGKIYKLRIDKNVDERQSIVASTHAAAKYFRDLYNIFSSWELALSAYNAGEYRVIGAIRKGKTRDYKKLVEMGLLPSETIAYVPKIAAASTVFQKLKLDLSAITSPWAAFEEVTVTQSFSPSQVAKSLNMELRDFYSYNTHLKKTRSVIPVRKNQNLKLYIPNHISVSSLEIKKVAAKKEVRRVASNNNKKSFKIYRVKRGDMLNSLARRFKTSVGQIKKLNRLKRSHIQIGQRLKIPRSHEDQIFVGSSEGRPDSDS
jgi:membrane-bound lytic murein transglycosylase D